MCGGNIGLQIYFVALFGEIVGENINEKLLGGTIFVSILYLCMSVLNLTSVLFYEDIILHQHDL